MPSTAEISSFQRNHPVVALWCMDSANSGLPCSGGAWAEPEDVMRIEDGVFNALRQAPNEPARMYEATMIANGDYRVYDQESGETFQYRVWLVRSGRLSGQRIIKYRFPDGTYRGFAFLSRNAELVLWQRFQRDHAKSYVKAFRKTLIACLTPALDHSRLAVTVAIQPRCPICNEPAATLELADDSILLPLCSAHAERRDDHPLATDPDIEIGVEDATPIHQEEETDRQNEGTPTRSRRRVTPLLSENGTGYIR